MAKISIKSYQTEDENFLRGCMDAMQRHIANLDPQKRSLLPPHFSGEKWVKSIFNKIKKNGGIVLIAEYKGKKAGCIVGIIKKSTKEDLLDSRKFKDGRIIELFIDESYRGKKIGSSLLLKMEEYFREKGCSNMELGCLCTNIDAYKFYKKHGFSDKYIDMYKKL